MLCADQALTHREPVVLYKASSVTRVGVPCPPYEVTQCCMGVHCRSRVILHVLGHIAQEQHVCLLEGQAKKISLPGHRYRKVCLSLMSV